MEKRKITPHKGGRTKKFSGFRVSGPELETIETAMAESGLGRAEFILMLVESWNSRKEIAK